ncbi:3-oxoacyl-ACP reductase FabG [Citricoccus sp. NR2]|uniref:3-oxoacyl-ACP reductase FabG n=1 Tax=Citricoccus sp. NR2 TaxID=3004095 RepID=UPI0022DD396E|nr:3-oxoacyl-ACP reductase FabG [Citricoccus sp. NR2]WBL19500.1 3-oxoacyl-ACP reductase FabG [Citricoccus sp. NR2]
MIRLDGLDMNLLDGKAAVVTGAAQGIGRAMAQVFAENRASVVISDINADAAEAAATELRAEGHEAIAIAADVTKEADIENLVKSVQSKYGSLDVMVNNAGITRDATMRKMTADAFDQVIQVHLRGCWLGTRAAASIMREQGSGSIVNLSSISGKVGNIGQTNYAAAKAGIVGLTKSAAKEVGFRGVRVNAIQPGLIKTAMTAAMPADIFAEREKDIPLGRAGDPRDVANAALFLASDLAAYVTGIVVEVSGGRNI